MSIFEQWGVRPIINASGAVTRLGGAPMPAEVVDAFRQAALESVPLDELQGAASREIAKATGAEAGMVTCGSASGLTLGAAAILAGFNFARMEALPFTDGLRNEFIMAREQRNGYDHAVRAAGVRLVEVGFNEIVSNAGVRRTEVWEYADAIGPKTAGIFYVYGPDSAPPLADVVKMARLNCVPVLVDAAGELPPRSNLRKIVATGADLVAFSGGKAVRGPQATGILCGCSELIVSALLQMLDMDDHQELWSPPPDLFHKELLGGIPRHGIGRGFKVSKEQIAALLVALRLFASGVYDREIPDARRRLETIAQALTGCPVACEIIESDHGESLPLLKIAIDPRTLGRSALEVCRSLRAGEPSIQVGHGQLRQERLIINPMHLNDERTAILARRLAEELTPASR